MPTKPPPVRKSSQTSKQTAAERWVEFVAWAKRVARENGSEVTDDDIAADLGIERHRIGIWGSGKEPPSPANRAAIEIYTAAWPKGAIKDADWPRGEREKPKDVKPFGIGGS